MTDSETASTLQQLNGSTITERHRAFSLSRILAITSNTLTELTRLKVFYVLLVFGLLLIGSSIFMAQFSFQQEFQILKDVSLGAISMFTSLLAIVATSRMLPRDIEDRTVYTILAKPVPRFEYVVGKIAGVLLLLAISTLIMVAAFLAVLYMREQAVLQATAKQMASAPPDQLADALRAVHASAFNVNLVPGIIIIFLKACLLTALTLFVSTFATSTIFTIVVMVFIYFIGHLEATAREYWLTVHGGGLVTRVCLAIVALLFPDLQAFNLVDDIIAGTAISMAVFTKTALLGIFYTVIYTLLAVFVFAEKNYDARPDRAGGLDRDRAAQIAGRTRSCSSPAGTFPRRRIHSRSSRTTRATRIHGRAKRISSHCRRWSVHPGARGLGKYSMGPNAVAISTSHNAPTTCAHVLGHSRVAHGMERERSGDERYQPAASGAASQSTARIFRARERFPRARNKKQS